MRTHSALNPPGSPANQQIVPLYEKTQHACDSLYYETNTRHTITIKALFQILDAKLTFKDLEKSETIEDAKKLLANRWKRISHTNLSYTSSTSLLNQFCIKMASLISESTGEEVYKLIMPTLKNTVDLIEVFGDLKELDLTDFVMSDNNEFGLPVAMLYHYCNPDTRVRLSLQIPYTSNVELSRQELERLSNHSIEASNLMLLHTRLHEFKRKGNETGVRIQKLIDGLYAGDVNHDGTDQEAGQAAFAAYEEFKAYLNSLNEKDRNDILSLSAPEDTFKNVWDVLTGKDKKSINCVNVCAHRLERILSYNKMTLYSSMYIEERFNAAKRDFERCVLKEKKFHIQPVYKDDSPESIDKLCDLLMQCIDVDDPRSFKKFDELHLDPGIFIKSTRDDFNILLEAAGRGNVNLVMFFMNAFPCAQYLRDADGNGVLIRALRGGHYNLVENIIKKGININKANSDGLTALHYAVMENKHDLIHLLLKHGADVNQRDNNGMAPLHFAAEKGQVETCQILLAAGADINAQDGLNRTPLYIACMQGKVEMAHFFLQQNAQIEAINKTGKTALSIAAESGHLEILLELLHRGARVEYPGPARNNPVELAIRNHRFECANALLDLVTMIPSDLTNLDLARLKFFTEDLTAQNAKAQFDRLYIEFRERGDKARLQAALLNKLKLILAGKDLNEIKLILTIAARHPVFRNPRANNQFIAFFKNLSPSQKEIKHELHSVKERIKSEKAQRRAVC